jgi:hypothetical protein
MNKIQRPLLRKRCLCCFTFCNSHCAGETQRFSLSVFFAQYGYPQQRCVLEQQCLSGMGHSITGTSVTMGTPARGP